MAHSFVSYAVGYDKKNLLTGYLDNSKFIVHLYTNYCPQLRLGYIYIEDVLWNNKLAITLIVNKCIL